MTYELDHAGFIIRDSKGLHIVVYGIQRGLGMEVFPVDLIYRPWKHAEGQVIDKNIIHKYGIKAANWTNLFARKISNF